MARCISCGTEITPGAATCGGCGQRTLRLNVSAKVPIFTERNVELPNSCACCLGSREVEGTVQVYVAPRRFFHQPIPYCKACKSRSTKTMLALGVCMIGGMFAGLGLYPIADWLGLIGLFVGLIGGAFLSARVRRLWDLPGHAPGCTAVGPDRGGAFAEHGGGGHIVFQNLVFAEEWNALNGTTTTSTTADKSGPLN